ncbi:hypothetical protein [Poritiphilus flavus]|uniref:Lipoprotein n=1 Tax=Poritiphilus flavus TaxID=2697053 RepID=A0A6L9ECR7_9FLAO|nr:hypothetical protein [Poritiphilus flavus]NAS12540.1 hypothetical protein [Poritiphilus flavus]
MKKIFVILLAFGLFACQDDDEGGSINQTDIDLVTGIDLRQTITSPSIRLGNPNSFNTGIALTPNPNLGTLIVTSTLNVSDIWLIAAEADKVFQDVDFRELYTADPYEESEVVRMADLSLNDLNGFEINVNMESLDEGYYRIFIKADGTLYWDNVYKGGTDLDINALMDFWSQE